MKPHPITSQLPARSGKVWQQGLAAEPMVVHFHTTGSCIPTLLHAYTLSLLRCRIPMNREAFAQEVVGGRGQSLDPLGALPMSKPYLIEGSRRI